jgi:non-ribosomal peptide synthetase component F
LDFKRPRNRSYRGSTLSHQYPPEVLSDLHTVARKFGVTQQNVMLASFALQMSRLSGVENITVGIPTADQTDFGDRPLVGYGVNLLPVQLHVPRSDNVGDVLSQVLERVLDAFEHKSVGFSELIREIVPAAKDRPALELVFNYSTYFDSLDFGALDAAVFENTRSAVLFDLFLNVVEMNERLYVDLDYSSELFSENTMKSWIVGIGNIVSHLAAIDNNSLVGEFQVEFAGAEEANHIDSGRVTK